MNRHFKLTFVLLTLVFLSIGIVLPIFFSSIESSSHFIFIPQTAEKYLVAIAWALICSFLLQLFPVSQTDRLHLQVLWFLRVLVTLVIMIFYEKNYNLDAYAYYKNAIYGDFYRGWMDSNGSERISYLLLYTNRFLPVFDSYHALKVIWSFLGLCGSYFFYRAYLSFNKENLIVLWALAAIPTILFWSSILGKDPVVYFGLGLVALGSLQLIKKFSISSLALLSAGLLISGMIRFWLVPIFLAPLALSFAFRGVNKSFMYWARSGVLFLMVYFSIGFFIQKANLGNLSESIEQLNQVSRGWSQGGSALEVPQLGSVMDIIAFIPKAGFTVLFRPLPGELNNFFGILAGVENALFLSFFLLTIGLVYSRNNQRIFTHQNIYLILTVATWSSIYGIIAYQNLGTAVRFKLQIIPFFVLLLSSLYFHQELNVASEKRHENK